MRWLVLLVLVGCYGPQGSMGVQGLEGRAGPRGDPGPVAGTSAAVVDVYRPVLSAGCSRTLDLLKPDSNGNVLAGRDGIPETGITYDIVLYVNGDVEASCTASAGAVISGSQSVFLPSITVGASTAGCNAGLNYPLPDQGTDAGFWRFAADNMELSATYKDDSTHPLAGTQYVFTDADCAVYQLAEDLSWKQTTLRQLFKM